MGRAHQASPPNPPKKADRARILNPSNKEKPAKPISQVGELVWTEVKSLDEDDGGIAIEFGLVDKVVPVENGSVVEGLGTNDPTTAQDRFKVKVKKLFWLGGMVEEGADEALEVGGNPESAVGLERK
ncbi:hypothetical protein PIB30_090965 [Stylosanthes scabra]|uniref:Uncharacterized protein n=1 Tax=Stylosanthes scabra TaxID=79078 RepID=A0ABU6UTU4_9FABA|nr:hypothetical protein [Stylosanthes scabra]